MTDSWTSDPTQPTAMPDIPLDQGESCMMSLSVNEEPPTPVPSLAYPTGKSEDAASLTLADLTTLHVGGSVKQYVEATTEAELIDTIREADESGTPLLMMGGGSNIVASDDPFPGVVLRDARNSITQTADDRCGGAEFSVTVGTALDELVTEAIGHHWGGFAPLSGIPGTVGAAPVQNVGAYGAELSELIASVRAWDRELARPVHIPFANLKLTYRNSALKRSMTEGPWGPTPRWVVLSVTFSVRQASLSAPIAYKGLADHLGVDMGERVDARAVREAVLDLRRSKGMVLDPSDHDTWSVGSFFTNPILSAEQAATLPDEAPRFALANSDEIKTSAAWLIDHAGMNPGFALEADALASLSTKHALAITNRGQASASDIRHLADEVSARVKQAFGVTLVPEPVYL
ncbi:UDP-N-acetylmuramate dehydrogenase [Actinomyces vulturis]|uniref:UDP-N-acetylmuramate dehydrogenase n=1 Tax=Actinomyces vulturis TaxID=1857645 RepID=UPI00082AF8A2|nr:UDP-N-acetylmuramate dehydrogenase [Actinomyces vulturis]